ncbi:hypothetical protein [Gordonia hongkongensis]|uniref:glycine-rich domain-containing protein n=1 Tax=Gordonia hongkongensis TaxID=1701090 RepID=UPI003D757EED
MPVRIPAKRPQVGPDPLEDFWEEMVEAIKDVPIRILIGIIGIVPVVGQPIANALGEWLLDTNEKAVSADSGVKTISMGAHNGWFGGGGTGDPQEVQYVIEAMADAIINGYNVETKVTSGTWTKPANVTELVVVLIGCGENGDNGTNQSLPGAAGGRGGGFLVQQLDPATVPTSVSYTVGTNGAPSSFAGVVTSPGSGGIATAFGYTETASKPGNGGVGGKGGAQDSPATAGGDGQSSALAAGGAGGAASTDETSRLGKAGANVSAGSITKCGGGGGGGGGGGPSGVPQRAGGAGGPGGYPGGGGGGGGGKSATIGIVDNGAGGIGATGVIWIFWR